MIRTSYHAVTKSGSVPLTLVRVETTETITPIWPEPAKLRAVA